MPAEPRAIVPSRAPEPEGAGARAVAGAEARLQALLAEVTDLDAEVEALTVALADFARRYEHAFAAPFGALGDAERLVRRLQRLEDEVAQVVDRLERGEPAPRPARTRAARPRRGRPRGSPAFAWHAFEPDPEEPGTAEGSGPAPAAAEAPPEVEAEAVALKRLYRRLARVLHPDLARDAGEQARLGALMARVNAAYAKADRTALEVMAEKVGAGQPPGDLSPEERLAHLARRTATLGNVAASLRAERGRLGRSDTARLRDAAEARGAQAWFAETATSLADEEAGAAADAVARLDRLARAARLLDRARRKAMGELTKRGPTGARRAFDPLAESALVRRGAALLERQRADGPARALARRLEEDAAERPWDVALTILALFLEEAVRPPPSVESGAGLAERWELVRASWDGAPDLPRALARLPRHLEVGLRAGAAGVAGGLQLAAPGLAAGVRIALQRPSVAEIGRAVLAALGPAVRCARCRRDVVALHLLRTRGLDELNGLACPRCGTVARSYWRYGEPEGLEALAPHALALGLVAEQPLSLAGTAIGFQLLPGQREALTASGLRARFAELYLRPYGVELDPAALAFAVGRRALPGKARVAGLRVSLVPSAATGTTAEGLLELLRGRIAERFRG
jgi:hypothetical protein